MAIVRRTVLVAGATFLLAAFGAIPSGAQQTTETLIEYAAESSSAGFYLAITPPGDEEPAAGIFGATTEGSITSAGPAAQGAADVLALLGESPARAETSAPPDSTDDAQSPIPPIAIPGVATIGALQGEASSASEAEDGTPSTANEAGFTTVEVTVGDLELPEPIGNVGAAVTILGADTTANADSTDAPSVSADAAASGLVIDADLTLDALGPLCEALPEPLNEACFALVGQEVDQFLLSISLGPSEVACAWDESGAECDGGAAVAHIEIPALGVDQEVSPGEVVAIPPDGPFLLRLSLGSYAEEEGENAASAIASGLTVELIGADPALPGLITFAIGESQAAVSGQITTDRVTPRTGAGLLPLFLGGSLLAVAGLGLRRFLRRR